MALGSPQPSKTEGVALHSSLFVITALADSNEYLRSKLHHVLAGARSLA